MKLRYLLTFVATYAVFLPAGLFFRLDRRWYDALIKPSWTPSGQVIGLVWAVLFALIALSVALLDARVGLPRAGAAVLALLAANWLLNQAFTYFAFTRKDWGLGALDSALLTLTTVALIVVLWSRVRPSAVLLLPYAAWTAFATYLSWTLFGANR